MNTQPFDAPDLDHLIATLDPERHPLSAVDRATADALLAQLVTEPVPHPKFGTLRWQRAILPIAAAGTGSPRRSTTPSSPSPWSPRPP